MTPAWLIPQLDPPDDSTAGQEQCTPRAEIKWLLPPSGANWQDRTLPSKHKAAPIPLETRLLRINKNLHQQITLQTTIKWYLPPSGENWIISVNAARHSGGSSSLATFLLALHRWLVPPWDTQVRRKSLDGHKETRRKGSGWLELWMNHVWYVD